MTTVAAEISKNAIRDRCARFVKRWSGVKSEQAEKQTFWNEFFGVFGLDRKQVAGFEELAKRASTGRAGWIDLLFPGQMAVEHKTAGAGKTLEAAMQQLIDYLPSLSKALHPWLLVVSDFEHFEWKNLETGDSGAFPLADLGANLEVFWWMSGHGRPHDRFENEEAANLKATSLLGSLHEQLLATGYDPHELREWMTRILFCLFADDTEVWDRSLFHLWLAKNTREDGSDLGRTIADLFQVLDQAPADRPKTLDEDLRSFTYINGDLFKKTLKIPACNESIRTALLDACRFDWSAISPAIFGSMFQNVMTGDERRSLGAHYTSEENILKTVEPLFLDDLWAELSSCTTQAALNSFHEKLASLRFLDPACGCGNFLIIAYREVRRLETETLRRLAKKGSGRGRARSMQGQRVASLDLLCKVKVDQFYGIEIDEWPARIARTGMYLIDHIANRDVSAEFGEHYVRFPIPAAPHIVNANALRTDWDSVLPAGSADWVFGNPPFVDRKQRNAEQRADHALVHGDSADAGNLDYVTCWFIRAVDYMKKGSARTAFVATNSITQGIQVPALWPRIFASGTRIEFAHRPFVWTSEARGKAQVHVVIIGLALGPFSGKRRLFDYPDPKKAPVERAASQIGPYLTDNDPIVVQSAAAPIVKGIPDGTYGSTAGDKGHLLFDAAGVAVALADPIAKRYLKLYIGADEFFEGSERWILWLEHAPPAEMRRSKLIAERIKQVKDFRSLSSRGQTSKAAATPWLPLEARAPSAPYLFVPCVSSERREYAPMDFRGVDTVVRASSWYIEGADDYIFGVLLSFPRSYGRVG